MIYVHTHCKVHNLAIDNKKNLKWLELINGASCMIHWKVIITHLIYNRWCCELLINLHGHPFGIP